MDRAGLGVTTSICWKGLRDLRCPWHGHEVAGRHCARYNTPVNLKKKCCGELEIKANGDDLYYGGRAEGRS